jgi:hypothetical protein
VTGAPGDGASGGVLAEESVEDAFQACMRDRGHHAFD